MGHTKTLTESESYHLRTLHSCATKYKSPKGHMLTIKELQLRIQQQDIETHSTLPTGLDLGS